MADQQYWVIKVGSALLSGGDESMQERIQDYANQLAELAKRDIQTVVVSSGSIACGMSRWNRTDRPTDLTELQALSALGQAGLTHRWDHSLQRHDMMAAQVLLTAGDIHDRTRYLNARNTLTRLLSRSITPIVNENDAVSTEEISFGDNDQLAGNIVALIEARRLVILTDQNGLHERDPKVDPNAPVVATADAQDTKLDAMVGTPGALGRGGMQTKLEAARRAARCGADTWILNGKGKNSILQVLEGGGGTHLSAAQSKTLNARKRWIEGSVRPAGVVYIDEGAARALHSGRSLLPVGITSISGAFQRGDVVEVRLESKKSQLLARGQINYSTKDTRAALGQRSDKLADIFGHVVDTECIHRNNLILL